MALRARPQWRRIGREWHGPCPVQGIGKNTCWFAEGSRTPVRGGCRKCGGRFSAQGLREHLDAVCGASPSFTSSPSVPTATTTPAESSSTAPGDVWAAGRPGKDTPGQRYLVEQRRVWAPFERLPPSVRWLPRGTSPELVRWLPGAWVRGQVVTVPESAAGLLLYRFAGPGEVATRAVQCEGVTSDGHRVEVQIRGTRVKRATLAGSDLDSGRRTFRVASGKPGRGCWLVEGPTDALAIVRLSQCGALVLAGAAVLGVQGAGLVRLPACEPGPVTIALDGDMGGAAAALRLQTTLRRLGREARIRSAPDGMDWSDVAVETAAEREAIRDE